MAEINFPIDFSTSRSASFTLTKKVTMRRHICARLIYGIRPGREYRRFARAYEKMRRIRVKNGYDETNERLRLMAATKVQWKRILEARYGGKNDGLAGMKSASSCCDEMKE